MSCMLKKGSFYASDALSPLFDQVEEEEEVIEALCG